MRWVVVGAGGIGGGLGGALAHAGHEVHLVARGAHLAALQDRGLRWRTPEHDLHLALPATPLDETEPRDDDIICLATKLQDAERALADVRARWGKAPVATWTNGIHAPQWAAAHHACVVAAVLFVPASHLVPGEVCVWGTPHLGAIHLGTTTGSDHRVRDAMRSALAEAGFDAHTADDIAPLLHAKWVSNLAGAAQALVRPDDWERVARAAMAEGERILAAADRPVAPREALVPRPLQLGTIDGAQRGGGSTWQSLQTGRSLECRWLNGPMAALADAHNLPAPLNRALADAADRAMAEGWRSGLLAAADLPLDTAS